MASNYAKVFSCLLLASLFCGIWCNAKKANAGEAAHNKANFETWVKIAGAVCSPSDLSGPTIDTMDKCYEMSPLLFIDEPFRLCRPIVFNVGKGWAPKLGAKKVDELNHYRKTLCANAQTKREWTNCLKTMAEKYGTKMKPGHDKQNVIMTLYDKKMNCYLDLLDDLIK